MMGSEVITQLGVGGIFAILVIDKVLSYIGSDSGKGSAGEGNGNRREVDRLRHSEIMEVLKRQASTLDGIREGLDRHNGDALRSMERIENIEKLVETLHQGKK